MALSGKFELIGDPELVIGLEEKPAKRAFTRSESAQKLIKICRQRKAKTEKLREENKIWIQKDKIQKAINNFIGQRVGINQIDCVIETMNGEIIFPYDPDQSDDLKKLRKILSYKEIDDYEISFNERLYKYIEEYIDVDGNPCIIKVVKNISTEKDYLTRISTRQAFVSDFEEYLYKVVGRKGGFAFLFFDLDHFKPINDTYGHEAGDEILRVFCKIVRENIRNYDLVGRYGGDEIVLILKDITDIQEAIRKAEEIIEEFRKTEIIANGKIIDIDHTASVGIGYFDTVLFEETDKFVDMRGFIRNSVDFYLNQCKEKFRGGGIVAGANGTKEPARIIKIPPKEKSSERI